MFPENGDTECYPSLAFMVHSFFWLFWSHRNMESSCTHNVYSLESVETTVIVISCGWSSSSLELISALDKAFPMFVLRDTENYPLMFVLFLIKMTCWPSTLMTSPVGRPSPNCQANVIRPPSKLLLSTLRDTECYLEIFQTVTLSVKFHSWIPSPSIEKP